MEVAPDQWDVLTVQVGEVHHHAVPELPIHPFILAAAVSSTGNGKGTANIWAEASRIKVSCDMDMPPLDSDEEKSYIKQHRIPTEDMNLYKASRERSVTPYRGKQEYKDHINSPADRNAGDREWDDSVVRYLNEMCGRLHEDAATLGLAMPLIAFLRVPPVLGRVTSSLSDGAIHRVRHVVLRKELGGRFVEGLLKDKLKQSAREHEFVQFIDASDDCDWDAVILTSQQRAWLDTDARLGCIVQADYTFHVFGKRQPIFLGALVAVHPVSGRSLPLAFFLYKDSGNGIRRRTLEWALRELNTVMEKHAESSRSIEHIVVDWESAHIAAGLDFIMTKMEEELGLLVGRMSSLCGLNSSGRSGVGMVGGTLWGSDAAAADTGDHLDEEVDTDASDGQSENDEAYGSPGVRRTAEHPRRMVASRVGNRVSERARVNAAKSWLQQSESRSRFVVFEAAAKAAREHNFRSEEDIDAFAQRFDSEGERPPDHSACTEDHVRVATMEFQSLLMKFAKTKSNNGQLRRYADMAKIYGTYLRLLNRHQAALNYGVIPRIPLLHGCIVHFKRAVRGKALAAAAEASRAGAPAANIMRPLGDALFLKSPRAAAESLGKMFFTLQALGAAQLKNYLLRNWFRKSWRYFLWGPTTYTTNNVECIWSVLKRIRPPTLPPHRVLDMLIPSPSGTCRDVANIVDRCGRDGLTTAPKRSTSRIVMNLANSLCLAAEKGTLGCLLEQVDDTFRIARGISHGDGAGDTTVDQSGPTDQWHTVSLEDGHCSCYMYQRSAARPGDHLVPSYHHLEALLQLRHQGPPRRWIEILAALTPREGNRLATDPSSSEASEGDEDEDGELGAPWQGNRHAMDPPPSEASEGDEDEDEELGAPWQGNRHAMDPPPSEASEGDEDEDEDEAVGALLCLSGAADVGAIERRTRRPTPHHWHAESRILQDDRDQRIVEGAIIGSDGCDDDGHEDHAVAGSNHDAVPGGLQPSPPPPGWGIRNRGSDCFLIATIQLLRHNRRLQGAVFRSLGAGRHQSLQHQLTSALALDQPFVGEPPPNPNQLRTVGRLRVCLPPYFRVQKESKRGNQHDAVEVLNLLLENDEELAIQIVVTQRCSGGHSTTSESKMPMLRFAVGADDSDEEATFDGCLAKYSAPTSRTDKCGTCEVEESVMEWTETTTIKHLPRLLLVHIERVTPNRAASRQKRRIALPRLFDGRLLVGALLQRSNGGTRGHYVTLILANGLWWLFDDANPPLQLDASIAHESIEDDGVVLVYQGEESTAGEQQAGVVDDGSGDDSPASSSRPRKRRRRACPGQLDSDSDFPNLKRPRRRGHGRTRED